MPWLSGFTWADNTGQDLDAQKLNDLKALVNATETSVSSLSSGFVEAAQDALAAALSGTAGVSVTYNDAANTLTIGGLGDSSATAETIRDTIGIALLGSGLISVTVNDGADTITISTTATANSSDATLLNRTNHTGTQSADTLTDGTTNKAFLATERTKLSGIATGATANVSDASAQSTALAAAQAADVAYAQPLDSDLTSVAAANNSIGLGRLHDVRVASTSALTFTIASGSVTQITGLVVDGVTLSVGDTILIRDAPASTGAGSNLSTQPANGLYIVTSVAGGNLAVSRTELTGSIVPYGSIIRVREGTASGVPSGNFGRIYGCTSPTTGAFTWGTTAVQFSDFLLGYAATAALITGTYRVGRSGTVASSATPVINVDTTDNLSFTAQAVAMTSMTVSGSSFLGHVMTLEFTDNGTARAIAKGSTFVSGVALMTTTTVVGVTIRERYVRRTDGKYECFESSYLPKPLRTFTTSGRPSAATMGAGAEYYDTTLAKPGYSDGTVWRDAAGTSI